MKLQKHGDPTLAPEVINIETRGLWVLVDGRELFLDYSEFPWFLDAPLTEIINVQR